MIMTVSKFINWAHYLDNEQEFVKLQEQILSLIDEKEVFVCYLPTSSKKAREKKYTLNFSPKGFFVVLSEGLGKYIMDYESIFLKNGQYLPSYMSQYSITWQKNNKHVCSIKKDQGLIINDGATYKYMFSKELMERLLED